MKGKTMTSEVVFLILGTGIGLILGWIAPAIRSDHRPAGTSVAEIRARIDRESQGCHDLVT